MKVSDIQFNNDIYPREKLNRATVETYKESLLLGAKFPPIVIQAVKKDGEETAVILDGAHRWTAHKEHDIDDIEVINHDGDVWDFAERFNDLLVASHNYNRDHGDRVTKKDSRMVARKIAEADGDCNLTSAEIGDMLGYSRQSIDNWISDIRATQTASRDSLIIKLSMLGWTQADIGAKVGISRNRVTEIVGNAKFSNIDTFLSQGRSVEWLATHYGLDLPTMLGVLMEGKDDIDRFKELGWGLRTWDLWGFNGCDQRFGKDWPGRIPAQLVAHALYYFTDQGDLVIDPMGGGGVVPDTCLAMGRRCFAYDASDMSPDTVAHHSWDLGNMSWPTKKKADLIFFDPPYFSKMKHDYDETTGDDTESIGSMSRGDYIEFFRQFFVMAKSHVSKNGRIAFLNADWRNFQGTPAKKEDHLSSITMIDYVDIMRDSGWEITHLIDTPMSTERMNAGVVSAMQKKKIIGVCRRTLIMGTLP